MRQRSFIVLAIALVVLVVGAVGVYAYDKSRDDVIAKGVKAGGVDLSGMKAGEARATLQRELAEPLNRPVVVKYDGHRYRLSARRARVRVNTEEMVQKALDDSQKGSIVTRAPRAIPGGSVHAQVPVAIRYSKRAVRRFARRVAKRVDKPAADASIGFTGVSIQKVDSQNGRKVDVDGLQADVAGELVEPTADHKGRPPVGKG